MSTAHNKTGNFDLALSNLIHALNDGTAEHAKLLYQWDRDRGTSWYSTINTTEEGMSKINKYKNKLKQALQEVNKAVPYIQSVLAVGVLVNQQVPTKFQPRINAVLKGAVKDAHILKETLDVLVKK